MSRTRLSAAVLVVLLAALVGIACGFLWLLIAEPAQWLYTEQGLVLDEAAAAQQFGIVAWFVVIGGVVGLIGGWALERWRSPDGWILVPLVVVAGLVAALLCSRVGLAFGPPDPAGVTGIEVGDRVPLRFALDAFSPLLSWVIGGLLGLAASVYVRPAAPRESAGDGSDDGIGDADQIVR
ncbi:hypothetical protein BHE97_08900 [Aeromicrobium sp. PE09-221]|uniref:hypothetical protein n=1 Tax=Aeromicrobium sp. PE09-221 TaxID=1898043 RepID=UPI000B3E803E|nr:hypothetical protein [Aeromicrobium sp. PE09-221]OUZ09922.1 hypothetical protein BHE97_08900 [Aeromicrobium sp. PE09-221]